MKYAIVLLLGVNAWGQTATMPCVPGSDPSQGGCTGYVPTPEQMGKCPEGRVALRIPNDDGSPSGFAWCVLAKPPQEFSKNSPLASWNQSPDAVNPLDIYHGPAPTCAANYEPVFTCTFTLGMTPKEAAKGCVSHCQKIKIPHKSVAKKKAASK